jgi:small subunit ribosomal protein S14
MKNLLERDKKKRNLFLRKELSRKALKYIITNTQLPLKIRWAAGLRLSKLPRHSNHVRINTRCTETFRGKSVLNPFRLSRIFFRDYARFGQITGITKRSW